jgi:hypothetical protein
LRTNVEDARRGSREVRAGRTGRSFPIVVADPGGHYDWARLIADAHGDRQHRGGPGEKRPHLPVVRRTRPHSTRASRMALYFDAARDPNSGYPGPRMLAALDAMLRDEVAAPPSQRIIQLQFPESRRRRCS